MIRPQCTPYSRPPLPESVLQPTLIYLPHLTYWVHEVWVENLSLFALIYLSLCQSSYSLSWESFIIRLDILNERSRGVREWLRIFHYSPWYTYPPPRIALMPVENLSLFTLIYLKLRYDLQQLELRIFHYSPWYTYRQRGFRFPRVENLSLFTLIYLTQPNHSLTQSWESFIIHLDILNTYPAPRQHPLRIFHYSPWYT